jgi:homoserine dehydrogenase
MNIAVMGYGTIGEGVVSLISKNHDTIVNGIRDNDIKVTHILDLRDFPGDPYESIITKDFNDILNDNDVGLVVETMGGVHPAFDFSMSLLKAGKHVVTSNKQLVAEKGYELLCQAEKSNVNYLFEASVGGGIPVITPLAQCLAANDITDIYGILNGTTNFILTKMITQDMEFNDALKLAQDNGYAEKDPTADIEGFDAQRKLSILSSLCFGKHVDPDQITARGITKLSLIDVSYAQTCGYSIKLIAAAKKLGSGKISAIVAPMLVPGDSMLSKTDDVFNAVLVHGNAVGDVLFYGRGAGKYPTASAVLGDVMDCIDHQSERKLISWGAPENNYVIDPGERVTSLYVRCTTDDLPEAKKEIESILGPITLLNRTGSSFNEFAFIIKTQRPEKDQVALLEKLTSVSVKALLRVCSFDTEE